MSKNRAPEAYTSSIVADVDQSTVTLSTVVLTMGDRPDGLTRAIAGVLGQPDLNEFDLEVVVVGNGVDPERCLSDDRPDDMARVDRDRVRTVHLDDNVGIPAGRTIGADAARGQYLLFIDDDAEVLDPGTPRRLIERFEADPGLGAIALRLVDHDGRTTGRHLPRLAKHRPHVSGPVASFPGGAVAMRREALEGVGGYADAFFYGMEETDLALRLIDAGWRIWYAADEQVLHPHTDPTRHPEAFWRLARNRVWLAHRNLPAPIAVIYLIVRGALTVVRRPSLIGSQLSGYRDGWRTRIGPRRSIAWRTVWRLTRLGRPPVL